MFRGHFLDLPDDVLLRIFSHLDPAPTLCNVMEVCNRFAEVAVNPSLWKHVTAVDASTRKTRREEEEKKYLFINYDEGRDVPLHPPKRKRRRRMGKVGVPLAIDVITKRAGKHLQTLDLNDCYPNFPRYDYQATDDDLAIVTQRCASSLRDFRTSRSFFLSGSSFVTLASECLSLRTLHMTGCRNLTDSHLGAIVQKCTLLEDISVSQCLTFRTDVLHRRLHPIRNSLKRLDISVTAMRNLSLSQLLERFTVLAEVKADGCHDLSIVDPVFNPPRHHIPKLTTLNFDKISSLSRNWLAFFCRLCPELRSLSVGMLRYYGHAPNLDTTLPPLQYLNLAGHAISDKQWQIIFDRLGPSLMQCDVSRNRIFTGRLQVVGDHTFAKLEDLNIGSTAAVDSTVQTLLAVAPNLKFLDLSGCIRVNRKLRRNPLAFR